MVAVLYLMNVNANANNQPPLNDYPPLSQPNNANANKCSLFDQATNVSKWNDAGSGHSNCKEMQMYGIFMTKNANARQWFFVYVCQCNFSKWPHLCIRSTPDWYPVVRRHFDHLLVTGAIGYHAPC